MTSRRARTAVSAVLLTGCVAASAQAGEADPVAQVEAVERTFAQTMAERDHEAFTSFLSEEAVFLGGSSELRGQQQVADGWKRFFEAADAPFSWEPATVVVLDSGNLALSTGPVRNAEGRLIAHFTSIWRQEEPGVWRIILDKGEKACDEESGNQGTGDD